VRFDDGNFAGHAGQVLERADRIDQVIEDTEEQYHIELPHTIHGKSGTSMSSSSISRPRAARAS
jgi:hypothetical protein